MKKNKYGVPYTDKQVKDIQKKLSKSIHIKEKLFLDLETYDYSSMYPPIIKKEDK